MGAGTTVRFALLVVLLLVSSSDVLMAVARRVFDSVGPGCGVASAAASAHDSELAIIIGNAAWRSNSQFCTARDAVLPWWLPLTWPVLLTAATVAVSIGLSAWKGRRGRVVPLETIDLHNDLHARMAGLAVLAGLHRVPRVVVDPAASSTRAMVFGSNRRPFVRMDGGLLVRGYADPESFRTVLLHQFAHIRNSDVTIACATVAAWRVFLTVVILPYFAWYVFVLIEGPGSPLWLSTASIVADGFLPVALVALVYLAMSDLLRRREIYADITVLRWGASPRGWVITAPDLAGGALRRTFGSLLELWRTYTRWDVARHTVPDSAALFGVQALPIFLTGITGMLINGQVWLYLTQHLLNSWWMGLAAALATVALVIGVAGRVLWSAVSRAVRDSRQVPSGVRAGSWLGAGLAAGELVGGTGVIHQWLLAQPEMFVLVVLVGVVFGTSTALCARLWLKSWTGAQHTEVTFPVTVYLPDEAAHRDVKADVEKLLRSEGATVSDRDDPIVSDDATMADLATKLHDLLETRADPTPPDLGLESRVSSSTADESGNAVKPATPNASGKVPTTHPKPRRRGWRLRGFLDGAGRALDISASSFTTRRTRSVEELAVRAGRVHNVAAAMGHNAEGKQTDRPEIG
jgi:Zn-dependent protease with chaperone function